MGGRTRLVCRHPDCVLTVDADSTLKSAAEIDNPRDIALALSIGLAYIVLLVIVGSLGTHPFVQERLGRLSMLDHPWISMAMPFTVPLVLSLTLVVALMASPNRTQRLWVFGANKSVLWPIIATVLITTLGVVTQLTPWEWSRPGATSPQRFLAFVQAGRISPLLLYAILGATVVPLVEEFVFRFGLLQTFLRRFRSPTTAVVLSSLVFGAIHVGTLNAIDLWSVRRMVVATAIGLVCGVLTIEDRGRIGRALAVHATRNGMEAIVLVIGAVTYA